MSGVIHVLNGPNLNLLGVREPDIYGRDTLGDVETLCRVEAEAGGCELVFRQSNAEHEVIGWLHDARDGATGVVINPAAFGHSSYALYDAVKMLACPVVEVHISNLHRREEPWRRQSLLTPAVTGIISGLGVHGYVLAVRHLTRAAR